MEPLPAESKILDQLLVKADTKQQIYRQTKNAYEMINKELALVADWIRDFADKKEPKIKVHYKRTGDFESEIRFAGDTIFYLMHTNVFTFPPEHFIFKTSYVKEDPSRAYCGMILIYNFLSDSIRYNRVNDMGYLLARVFINKDGHYFIQGKRQYSFMHRDFANITLGEKEVRDIVEASITQATEFELYAPPLENIETISLAQKIESTGMIALKTGKRLGFDLDRKEHDHDLEMKNKKD